MGDALETLQDIYFAMETNLDMMLAACQSQADRDQVMSEYVAARQNYWNCINKAFHDDDPAVQALVAQGKNCATTITNINAQLGNIATVINDLTQAVTIGAQIAAKVIAV
jgi:uncharacterized membrane protein YccC